MIAENRPDRNRSAPEPARVANARTTTATAVSNPTASWPRAECAPTRPRARSNVSTPSSERMTATSVRNACIVTSWASASTATIVTSPITRTRSTMRTHPTGLTFFCDSSSRNDRVRTFAASPRPTTAATTAEHDPSPARQPGQHLLVLLAVDREDGEARPAPRGRRRGRSDAHSRRSTAVRRHHAARSATSRNRRWWRSRRARRAVNRGRWRPLRRSCGARSARRPRQPDRRRARGALPRAARHVARATARAGSSRSAPHPRCTSRGRAGRASANVSLLWTDANTLRKNS